MATNIVKYTSSTFEEILSDLINYAASRDDDALKNITLSSTGSIYMELLSGLASFLHHDVMSARMETSLDNARLESSILNMAHLLGYPVRRKSAPKVLLRILNNTGVDVNIPRGTPIGSFKTYDICPLDDYILTSGINDIYCVIGNWREHTFQPRRIGDFVRYFISNTSIENDIQYISPDGENTFNLLDLVYRVGESGSETQMELVEYAEDLGSNSCLIKTHLDGIVLVFGDGITGRKVSLSETYIFRYVTTDGVVPYTTISDLESSFSVKVGQLIRATLLYPGSNGDSIEKVRSLLSGYNYARRRMITLEDHKNILLSYPGIIDATAKRIDEDSGCCAVELTPLFENGTRLDEQSNDPIEGDAGSQTFTIEYADIFTQTFEFESNSIKLPQNDFTDGLATGTKIWVEINAHEGYTSPGGIQTNRYYYVIRGVEVDDYVHIQFSTTEQNSLLGRNISLYVPEEELEVRFDLTIGHYSDKIRTVQSLANYEYFLGDLGSEDASSFVIPPEFSTAFSEINNGDPVIVSYDSDANIFTTVVDNYVYYAIPSSEEPNRIQIAQTPEFATALNRVKINTPSQGLEGSIFFNVFHRSRVFSSDDVSVKTVADYLEFSEEDDFTFFSDLISNRQINLTNKVRLWIYPNQGSTPFISGIVNNRDYFGLVEEVTSGEETVSYKLTLYEDEFRTIKVDLTSTVVNGDFYIGAYDMQTPASYLINLALTSSTFTPESAYSLSNSMNLSTLSTFVLESGLGSPNIRTGDVVRLHDGSESGTELGTVTLPVGLELGELYYIISLGNGYLRFAPITEEFSVDNFITLSGLESVAGTLHVDFFEDYYTFGSDNDEITGDFVFYRTTSDYYNCINVGDTILTGNDDKVGGYPTGTKIRIQKTNEDSTFPFDLEVYYYIIRVFGTTYVKLATTKSSALLGNGITFTGSYTGGEVTVSVYDVPEETKLREYLEDFRVAGQKILFNDPVEYVLSSTMTVVIDPKYSVKTIKNAIKDIFYQYQYKMGSVFYLGDVHKEIVNIDGVIRAYISSPEEDIELATNEYFRIDPDLLSNITILSGRDAVYQS